MLLVLAVLAAGVEAQLPLQLHPVRSHEELVRLDILSCKQTRDRGDILLTTTPTVWHDVDLPAEVGDGPGEVVVDVVLLVAVAPAGRLYRRLPHELLLGGVRTAALRHPPPAVMSIRL